MRDVVIACALAVVAIYIVCFVVILTESDNHKERPTVGSELKQSGHESPVIVVTCPIAGNVAICTISKEDLNGKH